MIDLMERNREGRRGGNGSGNVSSSRRPRTFGFRDASEDESQNSRFHSKKESHGSRKRKKCRSSNGEYHFGQSEERDENYEDPIVMAASDEDDDLPPPTVGRQAGKLKIHLKNTHEEVKPIVVPRKLRTAMLKRYNESTPKSHNETRRKLNTEFAVANATTTCSGAAPKPAQDMKTNNHKIHSNKDPKVSSSTISEQEAEVAETLFDLARMFSSQATHSETKSQSNSEMKMGANPTMSPLSSVQHCSSPVATMAGSPSSSHNISALGASKRKHHDVYKSRDAGEVVGDAQYTLIAKRCLSASSLGIAADSVDAEQFTSTSPFQTEVCTGPPAEPLAFSMVASVAISPSTSANASLTPTQMLQTANCPKIEEKTFQREESDNHTFVQKVPSTSNVLENKGSVTNINDAKSEAEKDIKAVGNSIEKETPTKLEAENGLVQLPLAKNNCSGKSEIDLMVPPKPGDEINDIINMKKLDIKEKQEVDIEGYEQKDKTINYQTSEQENQMSVKIEQDVCKYQESRKANEQMKDISDQSNCLDRSKQDVGKESPRGTGKNVKADSRVQRGDRSASATTSMPIAVTGVTGPTLPLSMGLSGWSAGLSPLGYYSPVAAAAAAAAAAAWPSSLSLTGTSPVDENIKLPPPLFLQTRHSWKRSATHVYITRFIESQQQLRKNPLWAAAFAANTYSLSIPMAPGGLLGGALDPEVRGSGLGAGTVNGRGYKMSAVAKDKSSGPYVDVVGRKSLSQQQTQTAQQQLSLFSQTGSSNVFPVTQSASTSTAGSDTGRINVGVGEAMLSNGNSAVFSSSPVHVAPLDTENGTSNNGVASAAAVQAQLLHSVIQRNVFPYSFSHQQFGPLFSGHPSPQQVAQYYSNPFFGGSHLFQPLTPAQQSQSLSNLMPETTVTQKQQYSQGCNFAASGPLQQANHIAEASSVDQIGKKECVTVSGIPTAEVKAIASRSVYGQTSSVNFPPVLAAGMGTFPAESQDVSKTFVGKQESKMHQQSQTQLQSQYQAPLKWQQQQDIDAVNCLSSPAMNLKIPNPYASEPVSPMSIVKNQGSDSHPAVTLVMASQGHTVPQTAGDSMTGLVHYQTATDKSLVSGGKKQQQQHRTQKQRLVSVGFEDGKANIEECSFSNSGCKEDRKSSCKLQPNQTNMPRVDLDESLTKNASGPPSTAVSHMNMAAPNFQGAASTYYSVCAPSQQLIQGSKQKVVHYKPASSSSILTAPTTIDSTMVTFSEKTHSYPPTFSKMPQQVFPGHAVSTPNQGVKRGGTLQENENISQRSSAGSPGPATSGCTVPPTIPSMERAPGKTPRNHQYATNVVPSRLPPDSSISSSGVMPLSPLSPVPSGAVTAKSAVSLKDSFSPKSSSGSNSGKKTSMPFQMNGTTMLGSNCLAQNVPLKPSQSQLAQNQYDIHHQSMTYPFLQQTVHMEPVQKQSTVPQQYHLSTNQPQAVQLQKQSLTPQQNLQLRQQLFIQQKSLYFQTQSHQRLESQPQTTLSQHAARQMKPQSGQMVCHSQQLGNICQQQMLGAPATSFGIATTGDMPTALCIGTTGNISLTGMSDGVAPPRGSAAGSLTPAKLTTDINKSSSCFQKANGTGPTFLPSQCGPLNCVASTQQQINNNCAISSPYPNLLSQATSVADSTQKSGDDKPATSN